MTKDPRTPSTEDRQAALTAARAVLLDYLPKDLILAAYEQARGNEILTGKFASPESSAALAANAFGLFLDRPSLFCLPTPFVAAGSALKVLPEVEMRFPWGGDYHPWLDVAVETSIALIGIESKRYEPFRDPNSVEFSDAYWRPVWGPAMRSFENTRDALASGQTRYTFLKAAQLVKHAFGLRTEGARRKKSTTLVYLYAEPKAYPDGRLVPKADIAEHRLELASFSKSVSDPTSEVRFESLCYTELFDHWKRSSNEVLLNHAVTLSERFDV